MAMEGRKATLKKIAADAKLAFEKSLGLLLQPAPSGQHRPARSEVLDSLTRLEKRSTEVALLWGDRPKLKEGVLALRSFSSEAAICLLLHSGMSSGAGPTLLRSLQQAATTLTHSALALIQGVVLWDAQESHGSKQHMSLPQLAARMHDAIEMMKKTPSSNKEAVGREVVQCTRSVRDVVREIGEMKGPESEEVVERGDLPPAMPNIVDEVAALSLKREEGGGDGGDRGEVERMLGESERKVEEVDMEEDEGEGDEDEDSNEEGRGFDFDGDEMMVVGAANEVCKGIQVVLKELIYLIAALKILSVIEDESERVHAVEASLSPVLSTSSGPNVKESNGNVGIMHLSQSNREGEALEQLLELCKRLSLEVDEIGASLYPPQEYRRLQQGGNEIGQVVSGIRAWVSKWAVQLPDSLSVALGTCDNARLPFLAQIERVMLC